jgi:steroid 5-alpha reductase family enzyme
MFELLLINMLTYGAVVLAAVTIVYGIAIVQKDNSVMDIAYGPTFAISAWVTIALVQPLSPLPYLVAGLMSLWALRLGIRIFRKNYKKPEDARYAAWRTQLQMRSRRYFLIRSYLQINILQGCIITLVALPFIVSLSAGSALPLLAVMVGVAIFASGLLYETVADLQLDRFLARKRAGTEPAAIMTSGLFHFSRRPNYFGESLIWWGLALIVITLPWGWLALISPLLITYIVTKVTGPMLEKIFLEKYPTTYGEYMKTTSYFIPRLPIKKPQTLL